jgi:hypothetical protein
MCAVTLIGWVNGPVCMKIPIAGYDFEGKAIITALLDDFGSTRLMLARFRKAGASNAECRSIPRG